jgi:hypothetical protein
VRIENPDREVGDFYIPKVQTSSFVYDLRSGLRKDKYFTLEVGDPTLFLGRPPVAVRKRGGGVVEEFDPIMKRVFKDIFEP